MPNTAAHATPSTPAVSAYADLDATLLQCGLRLSVSPNVAGNAGVRPEPVTCCRAVREAPSLCELRRPTGGRNPSSPSRSSWLRWTGSTSHNGSIMRPFGRGLPHTLILSGAHPHGLQSEKSGSGCRHTFRPSGHPSGLDRTSSVHSAAGHGFGASSFAVTTFLATADRLLVKSNVVSESERRGARLPEAKRLKRS